MSHDATNWAIKQRGLKPAAKVVLWHLCDRYHPDNGCFPSQDTLARDCELSRSSLNDHLATLEEAGLLRREQRRDARTYRQKSTAYRFAFEADFAANPSPDFGHGAVSENDPEPCPKNGESRVRNSDTNPVREPVREPEREMRASEREDGQPDDAKAIDRAFWRLVKDWPGFAGMPKEPAKRAWFALSAEDRVEAERKFPHWLALLKTQRKSHVPAPSTYFGERLWQDVPEPEEHKPTAELAPPFGPLWQAARFKVLFAGPTVQPSPLTIVERAMVDQGRYTADELMVQKRIRSGFPTINAMHERAVHRQGVTVALTLSPLARLMEAVPVGSDVWRAWQAVHAERGWPWLPDPGGQPVVFFPAGGPEALGAFEEAVKATNEGNGDDGYRAQAAE